MGSMLAALGSYLQAKHQNGKWLVRIEDLDPPREVEGAAHSILSTLEAYGLFWDETVSYQSQRYALYEDALSSLATKQKLFACECSRKSIKEKARHGVMGFIYPGTCRDRQLATSNRAIRLRTEQQTILFNDGLQGAISQCIREDIGDIVLKRADGLYSYQLAVVADDSEQNITEIVRGVDLLHNTPVQIYLQQLLKMNTPSYLHLPLLLDTSKEKLSKQTRAKPVNTNSIEKTLLTLLELLNQSPPRSLYDEDKTSILNWAIKHWDVSACARENIVFK